jgi:hypothetical protein
MVKKVEVEDITDFLPKNFEEIMTKMRKDSRDRLRRLGVIP